MCGPLDASRGLSVASRLILILSTCGALLGGAVAPALAIEIVFDFRDDVGHFFGTDEAPTPARTALEFAARAFESFDDSLAAISPGGGNSWSARYLNPATGGLAAIPDLVVPEGKLVIFAGARNLDDARLGEAAFGTPLLNGGNIDFISAVVNRGQGSASEDFAPWGGSIAFDTTAIDGSQRNWSFDPGAEPGSISYDFYSVAVHELSHIFGFGTASTFTSEVVGNSFAGANAVGVYGGSVPLQSGAGHWAAGVSSPPFADTVTPSLAPFLGPGVRRLLAPLDYAAFADIGWQVPNQLFGLSGDVTGDGAVDGSDLIAWQKGYGSTNVDQVAGDVTGDRLVDDFDGFVIQHYFGAAAAPGAARHFAAVPEPTATCLALVLFVLTPFPFRRGLG